MSNCNGSSCIHKAAALRNNSELVIVYTSQGLKFGRMTRQAAKELNRVASNSGACTYYWLTQEDSAKAEAQFKAAKY